MSFIRDLAKYDYYPGAPTALAIGWLDASEPFATGACPSDVRDRLEDLGRDPVRLMRGYHYRQWCRNVAGPPNYLGSDLRIIESPDVARRSNGEIWITAVDGTNYAAPPLIVHYIDEHQYLPPTAFIAAVREGSTNSVLGRRIIITISEEQITDIRWPWPTAPKALRRGMRCSSGSTCIGSARPPRYLRRVIPGPTERLRFREMTDADLDEMADLLGDPVAMRYYPRPKTRDESLGWIRWNQKNYAKHGYGLWIVETHEGQFVGDCGLTWQPVGAAQILEVGYHTVSAMQGRGFATEAARACVDLAIGPIGESHIVAIINPANTPSRRVAEKIGLRLEQRTEVRGLPVLVYGRGGPTSLS